jgi:RimJ/RimL family protein N-acetyltransferase
MRIEKTETFVKNDIWMDGTKIGTVELCPERSKISRLIIFEPYQNKGYGTEVVKELKKQGYKSLWVRSDNLRVLSTFTKSVDL